MSDLMSLREAARQLGCSKSTVVRAVESGELPIVMGWGSRGRERQVNRVELLRWWARIAGLEPIDSHPDSLDSLGAVEPDFQGADGIHDSQAIGAGDLVGIVEPNPRDALAIGDTLGSDSPGTFEIDDSQAADAHAIVDVDGPDSHGPVATRGELDVDTLRRALDLAQHALHRADNLENRLNFERELRERAERQSVQLAAELSQYRRALTETAESLAEERARGWALQAQARVVELATGVGHDQAGGENQSQIPDAFATAHHVGIGLRGQARPGWGSRFRRWLRGERTG